LTDACTLSTPFNLRTLATIVSSYLVCCLCAHSVGTGFSGYFCMQRTICESVVTWWDTGAEHPGRGDKGGGQGPGPPNDLVVPLLKVEFILTVVCGNIVGPLITAWPPNDQILAPPLRAPSRPAPAGTGRRRSQSQHRRSQASSSRSQQLLRESDRSRQHLAGSISTTSCLPCRSP